MPVGPMQNSGRRGPQQGSSQQSSQNDGPQPPSQSPSPQVSHAVAAGLPSDPRKPWGPRPSDLLQSSVRQASGEFGVGEVARGGGMTSGLALQPFLDNWWPARPSGLHDRDLRGVASAHCERPGNFRLPEAPGLQRNLVDRQGRGSRRRVGGHVAPSGQGGPRGDFLRPLSSVSVANDSRRCGAGAGSIGLFVVSALPARTRSHVMKGMSPPGKVLTVPCKLTCWPIRDSRSTPRTGTT